MNERPRIATASVVYNSGSNVGPATLKKTLDTLGLTLIEVFEPRPERNKGNQPPASA